MDWINALERRLGHLAIPGLLRLVVVFNVVVYALIKFQPGFADTLELRPDLVYSGQIWRVFTYIFIPPVTLGSAFEFVAMFMYLTFLWIVGEALEQAWGSFRLNAYYLLGIFGTTVSAFCLGASDVSGVYLNLTLLFAFATLFPDYPVLFMYIIPVRIKWVAMFSVVVLFLKLFASSLSERVAITISLTNYFVFFGPLWFRHVRERSRHAERQQQFQMAAQAVDEDTLHHCKVCGRTELSAPDLEFRVASDDEEYCLPHLPSRRPATPLPPPLPEAATYVVTTPADSATET